jgi:hypothetical protein
MKKETAVKERDVAAEVTALRDGTKELGMECCPAWVAVRCGTMDLSESSDRTIAWRCPGSTLSEIAAAIVNLAETVPSDPDGISVAHLHLCVYVRNDALDSKGDLPGRCSIRHSSRVASDAEDDEGRVKIRQFAAGLVEKESRGFRLATVAELTEFEDAPGVITTGVALAS